MTFVRLIMAVAAVCCTALSATQGDSIRILPASVELHGSHERQQLLAQVTSVGGERDRTAEAVWTSETPEVATVDAGGLVRAVADGAAVIRVQVDGLEADLTLSVKGTRDPFQWGFRQHVIPVLTKMSCNSGACHGSTGGKNGLKLTLRGYDPWADHDSLTREATARRVSLAEPASSLFLLKPTQTLPHGGGKRIDVGSLEYRVLAEWIAGGAPGPSDGDPQVVGLEVYPREVTVQPDSVQRLVVRARYSDGRLSDVTRWARYSSTNAAVAEVDAGGIVTMVGRGEAAITVAYDTSVLYARLTVPHDNDLTESDFGRLTVNNYIDELVLAKLRKLRIAPSDLASDSDFVRRAYLDATGTLPTAGEVEGFLADTAPGKRRRLVDRLLESPQFADYWAYKWSDLLLVSTNRDHLNRTALWDFYSWIRDSVEQNKPWDEFARDIFSSTGSSRENGALNYFVLHKDTIDLAENTTQAFMGQTLTCARCHNHPLEKWTQVQYYRFANLFSRIGIKTGDEPGDSVIFTKDFGDIPHPRTGEPLPPTPLEGEELPLASGGDRKLHLSEWLASGANPYFARNVVSRIWASFFARGLVDPPDDLRVTNPSSNERLFSALSRDFVESGYDVKHIIRRIMNSGTYQRSSTPNASNETDDRYYSRYQVKRLPAEVILDAMSSITGSASRFDGYPAGMKAIQLPDVQVESRFLESFGRPPRLVCDVEERSDDPSIAQALHVINGETLNEKLRADGNSVSSFLQLGLSDRRILEHLYLSAFSRYPTESEESRVLEELGQARAGDGPGGSAERVRRGAVEDLMWAMLTTREFLFNH